MKRLKTWLTSGTKADRMFRNYAILWGAIGLIFGIFLTVLVITVASL